MSEQFVQVAAAAAEPEAPAAVRRTRNWGTFGAFVLFLVIVFCIVGASLIAPYDPIAQDLMNLLEPPTAEHWFGTDLLGRDVLSRVLHGGGPPLFVGICAVIIAMLIGVTAGLVAGYKEGAVDNLISRIADIQLSIPGLVLALLVLVLLGSSIFNLIVVIAIESWPLHFRVVRTHVQTVRRHAYIEAARLAGIAEAKIVLRHVAPGVLPLLAVTATVNFSHAVLAEAGLSFLGIGIQPPQPDWGVMVAEGQSQLGAAWWISVFPGLALLALLWSVQVIGDWLAARFSISRG